ncbi:MAG: FtsQ-type POTRA domain-containing protein [Sphingomonadales bacterium]|nr:FtsQ-type POTRA domain-containing protein [Sphingomonadales bacterium]
MSQSTTIRRGGSSARKVAARQDTARKVKAAREKGGSAIDRLWALVPISEETLHRAFLAVILGGAVALAWTVASFAGVPAMMTAQVARLAANAGFEVRRVEVRGVKRLNELKVYEAALAERNHAMPLVDLQGVRQRLLQLSWVQDARVSRQLPDTLVIDVVERKPYAALRRADRLVLIDQQGVALEPVSPARAHGRLVLSGWNVEGQVAALEALLDAAPALRPQVGEAAWVGNRRWNLTFRTGQTLMLPEGDRVAAAALVSFARLDGTNRLLGGNAMTFDMRAADRIYFRVPGHAEQAAAAKSAAAKPALASAAPEKSAKPATKKEND